MSYDTIVLSGGAVHGISTLGALQYAFDRKIIGEVDQYVGTSAGSICGYLLAIGYTPSEIMVYLCTNQVMEEIDPIDFVSLAKGKGAISFNFISKELEKMTLSKVGRQLTLKELHDNLGKTLVCITYNVTKSRMEEVSYKTYPELPCLLAIQMSCTIPFVLERFVYLDQEYVDGGVVNNYPVDVAERWGDRVFGIALMSHRDGGGTPGLMSYFNQLVKASMIRIMEINIQQSRTSTKNVRVDPKQTTDKGDQFVIRKLTSTTKLELFSSGYMQMKKIFD